MAETDETEQRFYLRWDDGHYSAPTLSASLPWTTPTGATVITAEEYQQGVAALTAAHEQRVTEALAQETAAKQNAYEALLNAGIPDAAAQQITGYRPPQEPAA